MRQACASPGLLRRPGEAAAQAQQRHGRRTGSRGRGVGKSEILPPPPRPVCSGSPKVVVFSSIFLQHPQKAILKTAPPPPRFASLPITRTASHAWPTFLSICLLQCRPGSAWIGLAVECPSTCNRTRPQTMAGLHNIQVVLWPPLSWGWESHFDM